jgi:hypothetical protein
MIMRCTVLAVLLSISASSHAQQPQSEQVLVPFDTAILQGAHGARWSAELRVRNSGADPINLFPETCFSIGRSFPCDFKINVTPGATQLVDAVTGASADSPGVLLYVPAGHAADVHFSLTVRDLASQDSVGTTVPVVRTAEMKSSYTIIGVPIVAGQRRTLRVYDPFLPVEDVFRVRVIDEATNGTIVDRQYMRVFPTDPPIPPLVPVTLDFSDALSDVRAERVTVTIDRVFPESLAFWPLISVTSDRDSRIAVFTPN